MHAGNTPSPEKDLKVSFQTLLLPRYFADFTDRLQILEERYKSSPTRVFCTSPGKLGLLETNSRCSPANLLLCMIMTRRYPSYSGHGKGDLYCDIHDNFLLSCRDVVD